MRFTFVPLVVLVPSFALAAASPAVQYPELYGFQSRWLPDYPRLNAMVDKAGGTLSASYETGPDGKSIVSIELRRGPGAGLTVVIDMPRRAFMPFDERTGLAVPEDHRLVLFLRDIDLDGYPDETRMEPAARSLPGASMTADGFMRIEDSVYGGRVASFWENSLMFCERALLHPDQISSP